MPLLLLPYSSPATVIGTYNPAGFWMIGMGIASRGSMWHVYF